VDDHNHIVGAEVLVRWQHPQRGLVSPLEFIPLAEETGLILPIGQWVLESACAQLKAWETHPLACTLQLAVNVSASQFNHTHFVGQVEQAVRRSGIRPDRLKLELTESMVFNIDDTVQKMHALQALGVTFSMDDFGTGYSSLSNLTRLPLSQLKIDQSFVRNMGTQPADAAIVQTIIAMAHNLGLDVIAEGVETPAQRGFLSAHGCGLYQGYLFGHPLALDAFEADLRHWSAPEQAHTR
jgi:EAL domain-containing protein (putative c-di-GMP-specific phosphodiesterase class I)